MTFTDPDTHDARRGRLRGEWGECVTVEIGRESTRSGSVLQCYGLRTAREARMMLEQAFELAGQRVHRDVTSPGWWAIVVGQAAQAYGAAFLQPGAPEGAAVHVLLRVEPARMLETHPEWPMARLSPRGPWLDLRGEAALLHGPSHTALLEYRRRLAGDGLGDDVSLADLRRAWDLGALEWKPGGPARPGARWEVRRAT